MSQYRSPTAYVLGVLVLLAVVVLTTPSGGTHARWSATAQAAVPAMTTGRIGFDVAGVAGAESSATLLNRSGFGVRYRPLQVSLVDAGGESVAAPRGMVFAYGTGSACADGTAPAQWTAVAPGGSAAMDVHGEFRAPLERDRPAGLCLTVSTEAVPADALRALDAREPRVVTQVEAASLGDGAWSTTPSWSVPLPVELPPAEEPPVDPPATTTPALPRVTQCSATNGAALLGWSWTSTPGAPAVTEWQIRVRPAGTTGEPTLVQTVTNAAAREARVTAAELLGTGHAFSQDYQVIVRAVLAGGDTPSVDSASAWSIKTPGRSGNIHCEGVPS